MSAKERLERLGWTPEKLRQRIEDCRKGRKEFDKMNPIYRRMNACLYRRYKKDLQILLV